MYNPYQNPQAMGMPPKHLATMLATLMLNKRLQQGANRPTPIPQAIGMPMPGQNPQDGGRGGNRMAQLAQMQMSMNGPRSPMGY
jgi:hypothetical protein